jgi:hypothetical protein
MAKAKAQVEVTVEEAPLTFDECAVKAMRLVGQLKKHGMYAELSLTDSLRLTMPAYTGHRYDVDQSVGEACEPWEFESFLENLTSALAHFEEERRKREAAQAVVASFTKEQLEVLLNAHAVLTTLVSAELQKRVRGY